MAILQRTSRYNMLVKTEGRPLLTEAREEQLASKRPDSTKVL